ncbi:PKD domain-containing protein [bacterium]|nr:PKD domain-containing protein [bacterium]
MQRIALTGLALLCAGLLASGCGGQTSPLAQAPQSPDGHSTSGFSISTPGAHGPVISADSLQLSTRTEGSQTVLEISAARPLSTGSLLVELHYDSASYSPLGVSATEALGPGSEAISIEQLEAPGLLSYGRVPLGNSQVAVEAGTVIATALFDNTGMLPTRGMSGVPVHSAALSPLFWDVDTATLTWYYNNPGDFDQNGVVGLADLVPLGLHFGESGPFDYESAQSVIDGNSDGEIGLADLSVIGRYWGNNVDGYRVFASNDINDVPVGYGEASTVDPIAELAFGDSFSNAMAERRSWQSVVASPAADEFYWVRPYAGDSEGTRSNINGGGLGTDPEVGPGEPDYNFLPEARLSLRILGQGIPLPVELDASASSDEDGNIIFYEWDFEGDGLFDAYGFEPLINHKYGTAGTFAPLVRVTDNSGGTDTFQANPFEATVASVSNVDPSADIAATAVSGFNPLTIGFIGSGSYDVDGLLVKFQWDFDGDGNFDLDSGSDSTVLHTYNDSGTFLARLRVTDNSGDSAEDTIEITVLDPPANIAPVADVIASPSGGTAPLTVSFDAGGSDDSDGQITSFFWSWDEGGVPFGSGKDPSVSHTFNNPGVYDVVLTAIDNGGKQDTDTVTITVVPPGVNVPPSADLVVLPPTGVVPLNAILDASGSNDPDGVVTDYSWDFGDGSPVISTGTDPTTFHPYLAAGSYSATVTVTDNDGGSDSDSFLVVVSAPPANLVPVADIFAVPTSGDSPLTVAFTGAGSTDLDGNIVSYVWDWDDGTSAEDSGADPTISHTFGASGVYDVVLTVQDDDGATDTDTIQVNVTNVSNIPPNADIYASVLSGQAPLTVPFTAAGSSDVDGVIVNYSWDWDDTTTTDSGADPSVTHTFSNPGSYSVEVTVTDNDGSSDTDTIVITVSSGGSNQAPTAFFTADTTSYTGVPLTVTFNPAGSSDPDGNIVRYDWDWEGDGLFDATSFTNATVQHTYTVFAEYNPVLVVTDNENATDSHTVAILPDIPPVADIVTSPNPSGTGVTVTVDASGSDDPGGSITKFEFDLDGNGSYETDNGTNPVATTSFGSTGDYILRVRITDNDNNQDTAQVTHQVRIAELITVTTAGSPATRIKADIIGGNPAIIYYDASGQDLKYVRATNTSGTSWGSPVTVAFTGDVGRNAHLVEANGRPAVCYNNNSGGLFYLRADDATGANWTETNKVEVYSGSVSDCEMEVISGNPAICYIDNAANATKYVRASNADGSSWGTVRTVNSGGTNGGGVPSLAVVNGMPAVAFFYWNGAAGVKYRRASDVDGASWGSTVTIASNASVNDSYDNPSLLVINGNPAISYESRAGSDIVYKRATDANGTSWGSQVNVATNDDNTVSSLLWSNSLPFVAYFENNANQVRMAWGSDASGTAFDATDLVDTGDNDIDTIEVGGNPFIVYFNGGVKVARVF